MKHLIIIFYISFLYLNVYSQRIIAGKVNDSTCIRVLTPYYTVAAIPNSPSFYVSNEIDLNKDGINDIKIYSYYNIGSHGMYVFKEIGVISLNTCKIAISRIDTSNHAPSVDNFLFPVAKLFSLNDTINALSETFEDTVYFASDSYEMGEFGIVIDDLVNQEGYFAVLFPKTYEIYWIKVYIGSITSIDIQDYLYNCYSNEINEIVQNQEPFVSFPNPCMDFVNFESKKNNLLISLYSLNGTLLKSNIEVPANNKIMIDIRDLKTGIYIVKIIELVDNLCSYMKIIKY
jgi:hypothetical protein